MWLHPEVPAAATPPYRNQPVGRASILEQNLTVCQYPIICMLLLQRFRDLRIYCSFISTEKHL